jgi:hypothetical protein
MKGNFHFTERVLSTDLIIETQIMPIEHRALIDPRLLIDC